MTKDKIIEILEEISVLLELSGENPFKSRAYSIAARNLEKVEEDIADLVQSGKIFEIQGIGEAIGQKISALQSSGRLEYYEKLKGSIPAGHLEMLKISGLGPRKIHALYQELGITTLGELEYACHENRLADLKGFGKKTQDNILAGIERLKRYAQRRRYDEALKEAQSLLKFVEIHDLVDRADIAGSLRRGLETVKDIDLLVATNHPQKVGAFFASYEQVDHIVAQGDTKVSVTLKSGVNADLRMVSPDQYPYALHHFTGSHLHNTAMRGRAKGMGLRMNEYGLFRGQSLVVCRTEEEIFKALRLKFIEPELREDMGEIEAAEKGQLPILIEREDVRGLFHVHTHFSDGTEPLEKMVQEARKMGMAYIGISDHSQSAFYAGGLKIEDIERQHAIIDALNQKWAPFHIFKGIESDIAPDGRLDYEDHILSRFDFVIAAVHSHFKMSEEEMTARICRALSDPHTTMLAHPTGRLLLSRDPYSINMPKVIETAARYNKVLELNANPQRFDLDWRHCIIAQKKGVKIAVNPDAHSVGGLYDIDFGVKIARKGWISKENCLNCLSLEAVKAYLDRTTTKG